ncbi:hypothetical protein FACS189454_08280 [Planctomycetales bacterium]|nr:hypothetical protein FACS189454_08280 [Planctomycetales bacterium]
MQINKNIELLKQWASRQGIKQAFVDPSQMGGQPPMDPAAMGGVPMGDPMMAQGAAPPQGGMPPGGDPAADQKKGNKVEAQFEVLQKKMDEHVVNCDTLPYLWGIPIKQIACYYQSAEDNCTAKTAQLSYEIKAQDGFLRLAASTCATYCARLPETQ